MTDISEYDYNLPDNLIAQEPAHPRESARLMVLPSGTEEIIHDFVGNFPQYVQQGDVVVINNTKVFKARLQATVEKHGEEKHVEIFLVKPQQSTQLLSAGEQKSTWVALGKPGKKIVKNTSIHIAKDFEGKLIEKYQDGTLLIEFPYTYDDVIQKANTYGTVPIPPYIKKEAQETQYQTVYAKHLGSVAAPTAGFHMTKHILQELKDKGVSIVEITLHVGLGTFLPVKSETIEEHIMHSEWVEIPEEACDIINTAKKEKRRIIAIGTTTVRALEGSYAQTHPWGVEHTLRVCKPFRGDVNIFITPGFEFHVVDCLLTNFHLPKSTLLLLVSAFAGKERIRKAYEEAVQRTYRFYSFGDAMFLGRRVRGSE